MMLKGSALVALNQKVEADSKCYDNFLLFAHMLG